jgi:hypothetical protein
MVDGLDLMINMVKRRDITMRTNVEAVNRRLLASGSTGFHFN